MKNNIFFVVLAVLFDYPTTTVRSQNYYPLPLDDGVWQESYIMYPPNTILSDLNLYYFDGDTIIDGFAYKKMFTEGTWSIFSSFGSSSGDFPKTYNGAMRQDTSEKKVYLIERDSSAEVLLYDFDLSVGDTLKFLTTPDVPNPLDDSIVKVDSIGLITIDNTERHQYFYHVDLSDGIYTITESGSIIEGIGNIHGFIYSNLAPLSMSVEREITCVSLNGVQVFGTSPVCFQPGHFSAVPLVSDHSISVYEFQSGDQVIFHVLNSNNRKIHFSITNILGQIESTSIINATESWSIPGSELSSGLHMAIIGDGDKPISSFMFMVF